MAKKKETPAAEEAASVTKNTNTKEQAAPDKPERLIYLGPNLNGGVLQKYMVFKGGLPKHVKKMLENNKAALKRLFVAPGKIAETEQKIATKGTPEYSIYKKMHEEVKRSGL